MTEAIPLSDLDVEDFIQQLDTEIKARRLEGSHTRSSRESFGDSLDFSALEGAKLFLDIYVCKHIDRDDILESMDLIELLVKYIRMRARE